MPGEVSPRIPSPRDHAKGLSRPRQASRRLFSLQASSVSLTERTWALRPLQSYGRASRSGASAVVAISLYKAVNKATPSKGAAGIAIPVLRRQSAAPLQRTTSPWGSPRAVAAPAHRPGWTVAFSSFGDAVPCHRPSPWTPPLLCTRPPPSSLCGNPSRPNVWAEEVQDPYKRRDRKSTRLNSSHRSLSRMPSSA